MVVVDLDVANVVVVDLVVANVVVVDFDVDLLVLYVVVVLYNVVVDLLSVLDLQPPAIPEPTEVGGSLEVQDLFEGTGDLVESGDTVTVHYLGTLTDGTVFDASWRRGMPFTTTIGVGMVIPGWDQGIVGMREGGRRLLKIPSELAYGERGSGAAIPPNTPLLFVVDLIRIQS